MAVIKGLLTQRRWFTIQEIRDEIIRRLPPEFLIRWLLYKRSCWAGHPLQYADLERAKIAGARHMMADIILRLEKQGVVERSWKRPKGVASRNLDAWMCRATQKGIDRWEQTFSKETVH